MGVDNSFQNKEWSYWANKMLYWRDFMSTTNKSNFFNSKKQFFRVILTFNIQVLLHRVCHPKKKMEWPDWPEIFDFIVRQKQLSDTDKVPYIRMDLKGHAKAAKSGLGFN